MKKILILIDPENPVNNVAASCIMLGAKLPANLVLFSTYLLIPVTDVYAGTPWIDEGITLWEQDTKEKLNKLSDWLHTEIKGLDTKLHKPTIQIHISEGNLGSSVKHFIQENEVEMVVMGSKSSNSIEHLLMGSDTQSVINECERPILIIPKGITLNEIDKITYASDFNLEEMSSLNYLFHLGERLNFRLEIVHIRQFDEDKKLMERRASEFTELADKFNYPHLSYKIVSGKDVIERLTDYSEENNSDVLAMMHHQRNFFGRLIYKSVTKTAISNQNIPLLVLPSKLL
ncbi:universal stress protein [Pedobacter immunditicola]|uniref:universal stress protein n=1 Tax=Pedobacter immunditicola TaxID=3133440 RepID=UPI0030B74666